MKKRRIKYQVSRKTYGKLISALESARMRLSVDIAMEAKSTPRERWRNYLETADQIGRFIKKLRKADFESLPDFNGWSQSLEKLCNLPIEHRALRLCEILRDIASGIE